MVASFGTNVLTGRSPAPEPSGFWNRSTSGGRTDEEKPAPDHEAADEDLEPAGGTKTMLATIVRVSARRREQRAATCCERSACSSTVSRGCATTHGARRARPGGSDARSVRTAWPPRPSVGQLRLIPIGDSPIRRAAARSTTARAAASVLKSGSYRSPIPSTSTAARRSTPGRTAASAASRRTS